MLEFLNTYVYIYMNTYVHIYIYMNTYVYIYIYVYVYFINHHHIMSYPMIVSCIVSASVVHISGAEHVGDTRTRVLEADAVGGKPYF